MKNIIYLISIIFSIGVLILSCDKDSEDNTQLTISGKLTNNSDCKSSLKSSNDLNETADSLSCLEYSFHPESNKLNITLINAGFNCCPGNLYCEIELDVDTIIVREFEQSASCSCNSLYDLEIEIDGIEAGTYKIKIVEPYVDDQEELLFAIDLTKYSEGEFCVTRKVYPWGIESVEE